MADKMNKLIEDRNNRQIGWDMAMQSMKAYTRRASDAMKKQAVAGMDKDVLNGIRSAVIVLEEVHIYANNQVGVPPATLTDADKLKIHGLNR